MDNIIFDIGNVLLRFDPETYLLNHFDEKTTYDLMTIIFSSEDWELLDLGNTTTEEVIQHLASDHPEYKDEIAYVMHHWISILTPIEENVQLISKLKEKGYKLYLLSNFHDEAFNVVSSKFEFFKLFDGGVISYEIHELKPFHQIYETLLKRYHLNPLKSIFIDDMYANTLAANRFDINTIWLKYGTNLEDELKERNIL